MSSKKYKEKPRFKLTAFGILSQTSATFDWDIIDQNTDKESDGAKKFYDTALKEHIALVRLNDGNGYLCPILYNNKKKKNIAIPHPDPASIYMLNALEHIYDAKHFQYRIWDEFATMEHDMYRLNDYFSSFIIVASTGLFFAFASIESLVYKLLPDDFKHDGKDKNQLMLECDLKTKIKTLLPAIGLENFCRRNNTQYLCIIDANKLRNNAVHMKYDKLGFPRDLYQKIVEFDFDRLQNSLISFFNTYSAVKIHLT